MLLLRGSLKPSSSIISGTTYAKIRRLTDASGAFVKAAYPGTAAVVSGWKKLPLAGDEVLQGKEEDVKRAVSNRLKRVSAEAALDDAEIINAARRVERERKAVEAAKDALDKANKVHYKERERERNEERRKAKPAGPKELRVILKGDVSGSVEAIAASVEAIGNKDAVVKVVSKAVGEVNESDVMMAKVAEGFYLALLVHRTLG